MRRRALRERRQRRWNALAAGCPATVVVPAVRRHGGEEKRADQVSSDRCRRRWHRAAGETLARHSSRALPFVATDHGNGVHQGLTHRAEREAREAASAASAGHDQLRLTAGLDQGRRSRQGARRGATASRGWRSCHGARLPSRASDGPRAPRFPHVEREQAHAAQWRSGENELDGIRARRSAVNRPVRGCRPRRARRCLTRSPAPPAVTGGDLRVLSSRHGSVGPLLGLDQCPLHQLTQRMSAFAPSASARMRRPASSPGTATWRASPAGVRLEAQRAARRRGELLEAS